MSIQQFRTALSSRSEHSAGVRAYRALARRPEAAAMTFVDWVAWPPAAAPTA
jgi:hypothetical protein